MLRFFCVLVLFGGGALPAWPTEPDVSCRQNNDCVWSEYSKVCQRRQGAAYGARQDEPSMFCVCEDSRCGYPSDSWIRAHPEDAIQGCEQLDGSGEGAPFWGTNCFLEIAPVLGNIALCERLDYEARSECIIGVSRASKDPQLCKRVVGKARERCLGAARP